MKNNIFLGGGSVQSHTNCQTEVKKKYLKCFIFEKYLIIFLENISRHNLFEVETTVLPNRLCGIKTGK